MCIAIIYFPVCDIINFETNLIKSIKLPHQAVSLHDQKGQEKNLNILRTKKPLFNMR